MKKLFLLSLVALSLLACSKESHSKEKNKVTTTTQKEEKTSKPTVKSTLKKDIQVGIQRGNKLPEATFETLDGKKVEIPFTAGKLTILNMSTTWCPYCESEKEGLNKLYNKYKKNFNVISVFIDTSINPVKKKVKQYNNKFDYPLYWDRDSKFGNEFLVEVVPTTFVLDENGIILERVNGAINWETLSLKDFESLRGE